jgi:hypothetical protein
MKDAIELIETVYSLAGSEQQWLQRLAEAFRPRLPRAPRGIGLIAQTYDASRPDRAPVRATALVDYDPASFAQHSSRTAMPDSENGYLAAVLRTGFVGGMRGSSTALRRAGLSETRVQAFRRGLDVFFRELKIAEQFWINAQDPTYFGCVFVATSSDQSRWRAAESAAWRRVAALGDA